MEAACEALTDMPPRLDEELDAVTLHNQALMNMEYDPEGGFERLQFLLQQTPCPPGWLYYVYPCIRVIKNDFY